MCKKKKQNDIRNKPINEMTDTEFITNADYLASPYYRAYVTARARAVLDNKKGSAPRTVNYGYTNGGFYNNGNYNKPAPAPAPVSSDSVYDLDPEINSKPVRQEKAVEDEGFDFSIFNEDPNLYAGKTR